MAKAVQTWLQDDDQTTLMDDGSIWRYDWTKTKWVREFPPIPTRKKTGR